MPRHEQGRTPDQSKQISGVRAPQLPRARRGENPTVPLTINAKEVADTSHQDLPEGYRPLQQRVKDGKRKSDGLSEMNRKECQLLGTDSSSTETYRFLGVNGIEPFLFYSQPIDADEPSPVWDDLLSGAADNPGFRIAGILYEDRRLAWATNDVNPNLVHGNLSNAISVPDDNRKLFLLSKGLLIRILRELCIARE